MTVIAYRDGLMASDSAATDNGVNVGNCRKIVSACGMLGGASGDSGACERFLEWIEAGCTEGFISTDEEMVGLLVKPDKTVWRLGAKGSLYRIEAEFHAMGAGREVAMGVMAAGATAQEAVNIAIRLVDGCGGPVQLARVAPVDFSHIFRTDMKDRPALSTIRRGRDV